jgi:hypothetical protein
MPVPSDPYDFANGTTADAEQVDLRFKRLYDTLNPAVIGGGVDQSNVKPGEFLQLLTTGTSRKVAFGTSTGAFAISDGGNALASASRNHGLGVVPLIVLATVYAPANAVPIAVMTNFMDATRFDWTARYVDNFYPGAGSAATIHWLAIA